MSDFLAALYERTRLAKVAKEIKINIELDASLALNNNLCGKFLFEILMKNSAEIYGIKYYETAAPGIFESSAEQLYHFKTFIGEHQIEIEFGDCAYYFSDDLQTAHVKRGRCQIESRHCATIVRGFMPPDASCSLIGTTVLPYINGCSTKQIFPPLRAGDPTLQFLYMPAGSSEQEHHVHSTARVVLVLSGRGKSVVGLGENVFERELNPGMVCIFDPMCPHHFETPFGEPLTVAPLHIFSSIPNLETNHPMFNGTIKIH